MLRSRPRQKPRTSEMYPFPAARDGWIANQSLAQPSAKKADGSPLLGASILDNMYPAADGPILMRGSETYATLGGGDKPVRSMFVYNVGSVDRLFAATDEAIYNITSVPSPINMLIGAGGENVLGTEDDDILGVESTDGLDVVTDQVGGDWVSVQFATAGGTFLRLVNGTDMPLVYDGIDFSNTPLLSFSDAPEPTTPADLNFVWAYKQRLFFILKDSLDAYYLPVDQVGGELTGLPLGGIFQKGGSLLFGASWSLDAGNSGGLSEQCIFVTTEGEVAVFQGANPSNADDWSKVGVYQIGKPRGKNAFVRDGGDIIIATSIGYVRLSQAISRELAALGPTAVSYPIETAWNRAVETRTLPWSCEIWASKQMAIVGIQTPSGSVPEVFIANVRTGAWSRRLNWDMTCLVVFRERLFFGTPQGTVVEAGVSGLDQGNPYTGVCVPLFTDLGTPASLKITELVRAVGVTPVTAGVQVSMQTDYVVRLPAAPPALPVAAGSQWGNANWGEFAWGELSVPKQQARWETRPGYGYAFSPAVQVTSGSVVPLDYQLVRTEIMFQTAEVIS